MSGREPIEALFFFEWRCLLYFVAIYLGMRAADWCLVGIVGLLWAVEAWCVVRAVTDEN